jgi:hypothetical protein
MQDSSNINKLDSVVIFAFKERDLKVVAYFVYVCVASLRLSRQAGCKN